MICSACGGGSFAHQIVIGPFKRFRLEGRICLDCGSGEASGETKEGVSMHLTRNTSTGEEVLIINDKRV